jgi:hypothetical protein
MKSGLSSQRLRQARHVPERRVPLLIVGSLLENDSSRQQVLGCYAVQGQLRSCGEARQSLYKTSVQVVICKKRSWGRNVAGRSVDGHAATSSPCKQHPTAGRGSPVAGNPQCRGLSRPGKAFATCGKRGVQSPAPGDITAAVTHHLGRTRRTTLRTPALEIIGGLLRAIPAPEELVRGRESARERILCPRVAVFGSGFFFPKRLESGAQCRR